MEVKRNDDESGGEPYHERVDHRQLALTGVTVAILLVSLVGTFVGPALAQSPGGDTTNGTNETNLTSAENATDVPYLPNESAISDTANDSVSGQLNNSTGNDTNVSIGNRSNLTNGSGPAGSAAGSGSGGFLAEQVGQVREQLINATVGGFIRDFREFFGRSAATALRVAIGQGVNLDDFTLIEPPNGPARALYDAVQGGIIILAAGLWACWSVIRLLWNAALPTGKPVGYVLQEVVVSFFSVLISFYIAFAWFIIPRALGVALIPSWDVIASSITEIVASAAGAGLALLVMLVVLTVPTLVAIGFAIFALVIGIFGIVAYPLLYALKPGDSTFSGTILQLLSVHKAACIFPFISALCVWIAFSMDEFGRGILGPIAGGIALNFSFIWYGGWFMAALYLPTFLMIGSFFASSSVSGALAGAGIGSFIGSSSGSGSGSSTGSDTFDWHGTDNPSTLGNDGTHGGALPSGAGSGSAGIAALTDGRGSPGAKPLGEGTAGESFGPSGLGGGAGAGATAAGTTSGTAGAAGSNNPYESTQVADGWKDMPNVQQVESVDQLDLKENYDLGYVGDEGEFQKSKSAGSPSGEFLFGGENPRYPRAAEAADWDHVAVRDTSGNVYDPEPMFGMDDAYVAPDDANAAAMNQSQDVVDDVVDSNDTWNNRSW